MIRRGLATVAAAGLSRHWCRGLLRPVLVDHVNAPVPRRCRFTDVILLANEAVLMAGVAELLLDRFDGRDAAEDGSATAKVLHSIEAHVFETFELVDDRWEALHA